MGKVRKKSDKIPTSDRKKRKERNSDGDADEGINEGERNERLVELRRADSLEDL